MWIAVVVAVVIALGFLSNYTDRAARAKDVTGRVFVIDGDTLAMGDTRIRIFGIDTPEMSQSQGPVARDFLRSLIGGAPVTVHPMRVDRYGRTVATVTLPDGRDLGAAMISNGYALAYVQGSHSYKRLQAQAADQRIGLWMRGPLQNGRHAR